MTDVRPKLRHKTTTLKPPTPPANGRAPVLKRLPVAAMPLHAAPAGVLHPQEAGHGFLAVLAHADFRNLWAAQVTSQLADKFLMYTLLLYVYTLSKLALLPSLLMIAYTLPSVFLSAPAGVYADRHDKRPLMLYCNLIRAALILIIPISAHIPGMAEQVWLPIVVTLLFSAAGQVFAPAEAASIPSLVAREQITSATSLFITTVIVTLVVGVPAATLVSAFFGTEVPFYVATGLFVMAAYWIWKVRTNLRAEQTSGAPSPHIIRELREGIAILAGSTALRLGMAELTLSLVIVFTLFALGPAYMTTVLQRSPDDIYIVLLPATLGMIATAGFLGQKGRHTSRARLLVGAVGTAGGTLLGIGLGPTLLRAVQLESLFVPMVVLLAVVFGCALGCLLIPGFTVLQERTTVETRGRIFGGIFTVINASVALPLLLAGGLADIFHVDRVLMGLGILLLGFALLARWRFWNSLAVLEDSQATET